MSTELTRTSGVKMRHLNRFAQLARLGEVVFHTDDLANLWGITNKNTLYTTIKRYAQRGLLFPIHKGFYAIKPPAAIDPLLLGIKALHGYAYVSTETILREHGAIQQELPYITLVSQHTKRFTINGCAYYARKLPDQFLYQSTGVAESANGVRKATLERAAADLLYFNKYAYFDTPKQVDWRRVRDIQRSIGYPLTSQRNG